MALTQTPSCSSLPERPTMLTQEELLARIFDGELETEGLSYSSDSSSDSECEEYGEDITSLCISLHNFTIF